MKNDSTAQAVRLRHYQGQRLQAADLQEEYDQLTRLRRLHVRGLHDTWGIALGFEVDLASNGGVFVGPGLAYDRLGREIVLTQARSLPGPGIQPGEINYTLVMSYDADLGRRSAGQEVIPCVDTQGRPGLEQPVFTWRPAGEVRLGLEVPLAAVQVTPNGTSSLSLEVRRYTQPLARPHLAGGVTPPEQVWEIWREESNETFIGIQTRVDTGGAGFVGTPYYLASLRAIPIQAAPGPAVLFTSVDQPDATGFTFRVIIGQSVPGIASTFSTAAVSTATLFPWRVSWFGLERVGGCPPPVIWRLFPGIFPGLFILGGQIE
jgi:hypothetical protein